MSLRCAHVAALALVSALSSGCAAPVPADEPRPPTGGKADDSSRDVVGAIDAWNGELSDTDREAKYCKMAGSAFSFYRGTNHLFWSDLAGDPRLARYGNEKTHVWLQGDLHAYNFGAFDNDRGDIQYTLNDFDESLVADYQYDVWRMAASLVLIARANGALPDGRQRDVLDAFTESYLDTIASYRGNDDELDIAFTEKNTSGALDDFLDAVADDNSRAEALSKWTVVHDGARVFDTDRAELAALSADDDAALREGIEAYGQTLSGRLDYSADYFRVKSTARRLLAGTGSLGTPRYYALIDGPSESPDDDLILDIKRQSAPTAYEFLDASARAAYDGAFTDHARRHAIAMKALLDNVDDHLGWLRLSDGDYSVRERSVYKEAFPTEELDTRSRFTDLATYWGAILATTHSRSDEDFEAGGIRFSADKQIDEATDHHHSEFRNLVRDVAFAYADQVNADWTAFVDALTVVCP